MADIEDDLEHECENIGWDDHPDFEGCHGMCIRWFGTCRECDRRVYELWEPKGWRDCETDEVI